MFFLSAIVLLGILIFVHELGHFIFAKSLGVRVLKFSLGFGPRLIGRKYGETEYLISAVPLGGYVKMLGEEPGEELRDEDRAFAYNYQPVWKRFVIVFSGPLFNIIFAAIVFVLIFSYGVPVLLPEIGEVMKSSPANNAGLLNGDRIVGIDGSPVNQWDEMTSVIHKSPGKPLAFKIKRGNETIEILITPEKKEIQNIFGEKKEVGLIGIKPAGSTRIRKEGIMNAVAIGILKTWEISALTVIGIVKLIQRIVPADTIGGPILIFQMAGEQASMGAMNFFTFMAVISINLGVLNLLPIPILDGGHILFLAVETIRRKPLSEKMTAIAQKIGLAFIITLMVFALYNDIMRLITGKTIP
ncbi:MAG: RIP metalloprotease RseP [Nitrospirae bacterium]|nr:RIP metalloprotease RseP [Nitrospirota bacterium]